MASFNLKRFIKNPLKGLENAGRSLGKVAKTVAPILPPGARELASIGGSIAAGGNMMDHAKSGVGAYIGGQMGGQALGQTLRGIPGSIAKDGWMKTGASVLGSAMGKGRLPQTSGPFVPGSDEIPQDTYYNPETGVTTRPDGSIVKPGEPGFGGRGATPPATTTSGGGWMNTALDWAKKNPDLLLAGGSALLGAKGSADAARRKDRAMASLQGDYNAKAPLRDLSLSMLLKEDPRLKALPAMFRNGNPYER